MFGPSPPPGLLSSPQGAIHRAAVHRAPVPSLNFIQVGSFMFEVVKAESKLDVDLAMDSSRGWDSSGIWNAQSDLPGNYPGRINTADFGQAWGLGYRPKLHTIHPGKRAENEI